MRSLMIGAMLALCGTSTLASPCHPDAVSTAPGAYLFTQSGQVFAIYPGQGGRTASWLPLDRLLVCRLGGNAFMLIDLRTRGEHAEALYLP